MLSLRIKGKPSSKSTEKRHEIFEGETATLEIIRDSSLIQQSHGVEILIKSWQKHGAFKTSTFQCFPAIVVVKKEGVIMSRHSYIMAGMRGITSMKDNTHQAISHVCPNKGVIQG